MAGWKSSTGGTCVVMEGNQYCNRTGLGPSWDPSWGKLHDYANKDTGMDATGACCACGAHGGRLAHACGFGRRA